LRASASDGRRINTFNPEFATVAPGIPDAMEKVSWLRGNSSVVE
jgi:hypothetical protein